MESLETILEVIKFVGAPICKYLNYYRNLEENLKLLECKLEELHSQKDDIQLRLKTELHDMGKVERNEVKVWSWNVDKIMTGSEIQIKEGKKVNKWNCFSRARIGKDIDKKIQEVENLYRKGSFPYGLVIDEPPGKGVAFPPPKLTGKDTTEKKIWAYLKADNVTKIGVYGMGGVGKTTIMKHVHNQLLKETKFDTVIWVTVSKELNVVKLQRDIAHSFNIDITKQEDKLWRARILWNILNMKRYVLILDDLWAKFSLEDLGIPEPTASNGCKLLLTTRSLKVCKAMDCKEIKVEPLSEEEALKLFLDRVGHEVLDVQDLEKTVKSVVEECAGLPLAIITVASSLKGEHDIRVWRNALNELSGHIESGNSMEMEKEVFAPLKFSYDHLKDVNLQHCFLSCSLYPENYKIPKNELVGYWIAEGLVDEMDRMQDEYDNGHAKIKKLEDNCLLESVDEGHHVKMHDLVRDMALQITRVSPQFMIKAGKHIKELTNEQEWTGDLEKVSLMASSLSKIPPKMSPNCPKLSTLLLRNNHSLSKIPDPFFVQMSCLKVLDLSFTSIQDLPNSISDLKNLTALLLRWCLKLHYVPPLAKLTTLRTLDLEGSGIKQVPQGLDMLVNLKHLNLRAHSLETLPVGILPKLSSLQSLIANWATPSVEIEAKEVAGLNKLETFAGQFHDMHNFNIYVKSLEGHEPNNKYFLQVGCRSSYVQRKIEEEAFSKIVEFKSCHISKGGEQEDPLMLPKDIQCLVIEECHDVRSLCEISSFENAIELKSCKIICCEGLECVLSFPSSYTPKSLEEVELYELQNLQVLIGGESVTAPPPPDIFAHLKRLEISWCPKIKKLFTIGLLPFLEYISVVSCEQMEEIVASGKEGNQEEGKGKESIITTSNNNNHFTSGIFLPKLRFLKLENLSKLTSICGGVFACDSLQEIQVYDCLNLKRLPLYLPLHNGQPSPPPSLRKIDTNVQWWESLKWDHPNAKTVLQPFCNLS